MLDAGLELSHAPTPAVEAAVRAGFLRRWSTLATEESREFRLGGGLSWAVYGPLTLTADTTVSEIRFDTSGPDTTRTDRAFQAGMGISWGLDRVSAFARADYADYDSPFRSESYTKTVVQCGLGYSF